MSSSNATKKNQTESETPSASFCSPFSAAAFSRDEMNLVEFPLAVLSTRVNHSLKTLEFNDTQRLKDGQVIEREWIITGADKFGLPTSTDDDVVLALMRLSFENGFRERKIFFTRYELLKILRWSTEGRSYRRLSKSLDRLSGVRIKATNSFYSNREKAFQTLNFGLIDAYEIKDGRGKKVSSVQARPGVELPDLPKDYLTGSDNNKSYFIWSEVLFNSFHDGFIKKIDLDLYFSLKSAVSRRLYRYLDKHFFYKSVIDKNLMILAFEKLGVSRNYRYVSSVKQQLQPAINELVQAGYLSDFAVRGRGAETMIRFIKAGASAKHPALVMGNPSKSGEHGSSPPQEGSGIGSPPQAKSPQHTALIESIAARGVSEAMATRLLKARTIAECQHIRNVIRYYDHLVATNDPKVSKNPQGFLYRAVENPQKFSIPAQFSIAEKAGQQKSGSKRPEHKIIGRRRTTPARPQAPKSSAVQAELIEDDKPSEAYRGFLQQSLNQAKTELGPEKLLVVEKQVRAKFSCMKGVLKQAQIEIAIEGCIQQEIMALFDIPEYQNWKV